MARKRIMREFVIKELSAVDRPAQAHAVMTIMKRADDDSTEGDEPMTAAEKKQLDELQKRLDALAKNLPAFLRAGEDDEDDDEKKKGKTKKAAEDAQAAIKAITDEVAAIAKRLEAADAEHAEAVAKADMSDAEKAHYGTLDEDAKKRFLEMTADDRKKSVKKAADADPVVYKSERTGEEFHKSDDPRLVRYAKQADEDAAIAKAERVAREDAEFAKRADDELKVFSEDIAKRDTKIAILRGIAKMDEEPRGALLKMLEVGGKAISAAFGKIGHSRETAAKSAGDFAKRVDEIMARDKINKLAALEKAEREFPAEFEAYQSSGAVLGGGAN